MHSQMIHRSIAVLLLASLAGAQAYVVNERGKRASTRLVYSLGIAKPGEAYLHYGVAQWRKSYADEVGKKEATHFRLGNGYWATLHNSVELVFDGHKVPPNIWHVGLHRDANAEWGLTLMDATKVARLGLTSGATRDVKPDLRLPVVLSKGKVNEAPLRVAFVPDEKRYERGALRLEWGSYTLTARYKATIKIVRPKDEPKFRKLDPKRTVRTDSGLEFEEVRAGVGEFVQATQQVTVHYVGWHADGRRFDSSFVRKQPAKFPVSAVIKGWTEGLQRMKKGAVFRLKIPAKLAYGDRGAGPIKGGETLYFWVELRGVD